MSTPIECTTPRLNQNVNYGLWLIQCVNVGASAVTLVGDVDTERACACVGIEVTWETCVPSSQFCCEPKSALKKGLIKKKRYQTTSPEY